MTEEYQTTTDLNEANGRDDLETVVTGKDEPITTTDPESDHEYECSSSSSSRSEEEVTRSVLEVEADAFTRFIERQRLEVMFELRRLRLGERPVTGQPNRERIQTFLNNAQESQQESRVPSSRPAPPSAHSADINTLANLRCVSAALTSAAFRQDLESTIRRTIGTRPLTPVSQNIQASPVAQIARPIPPQPQRSPITRTISENITERGSNGSSISVERQPREEPLHVDRQIREIEAWQAITQLQRERIVVEISDLVHRQLVTSALESDFRRHLEQNVLDRLERGAPLQQEQEQQHQQQPTALRHTQPVVPPLVPRTNPRPAATNVDELSTRLDSMQQMLQLMFTMQMDMQRSLRHEIASAVANNGITTATSAAQPIHAGNCVVCLNTVADTVLYRCGHLCVCFMCGLQLQQGASQNGIRCPICRAPVEDILRVYKSSRDGE